MGIFHFFFEGKFTKMGIFGKCPLTVKSHRKKKKFIEIDGIFTNSGTGIKKVK